MYGWYGSGTDERDGPVAYESLTDAEVLKRAARALKKVTTYPIGSLQRAVQWGIYESCSAELDRRAIAHVLARIQQHQGDEPRA